jgi:hypothetical protein
MGRFTETMCILVLTQPICLLKYPNTSLLVALCILRDGSGHMEHQSNSIDFPSSTKLFSQPVGHTQGRLHEGEGRALAAYHPLLT